MAVLGLLAGCSFDPSALGGVPAASSADSGPSGAADAGPGSPRPPDASPASPDASTETPMGMMLSPFTAQPPVLDGELDPGIWNESSFESFGMSQAMHYYALHQSYTYDGQLSFASLHDANNLYFFFSVTDGELYADSEYLFQDDAIELYIDANGDGAGPYQTDDHWFVFRVDAQAVSLGPASAPIVGGQVELTDSGYNIELAIAKSSLGISPMQSLVGFNVALVDDDGLGSSAADAYGLWFLPEGNHCESCCEDEDEPQAWCDTSMLGQLTMLAPGN